MSAMHILYLYNNNWSHEISAHASGSVPGHRLFGLADLGVLGHQASVCPTPEVFPRLLSRPIIWRIYQSLFAAKKQQSFDCFVAVHEAAALPLLLLKRLGLLCKPIIIMNVALLHERNLIGNRRRLLLWLLPAAEAIICFSSAQTEWVAAEFGVESERVFFIPFGVDIDYFQPALCDELGDFCLSVGTNDGKDFATLMKAFPDGIKLVIATDEQNAKLIEQHRSPGQQVHVRQAIPIEELKRLYEAARMHIIPLREMRFSSGQTTLLENMALGKTVIISDITAIQDYVENGVTAICVKPGDVVQLRKQIQKVWDGPTQLNHIGEQAARTTRSRFSSQVFAQNLVKLIEDIGSKKGRS